MLDLVAKKLFLTKGVGVADDKLTSFEFALRNAGIAGTNIVLISSIFPPQAKLIPRKDGLKLIKPGQVLFTIYSRNQTNEPHRLVSASVGVAQPKDTVASMVIFRNTNLLGKTKKKLVTMLKI